MLGWGLNPREGRETVRTSSPACKALLSCLNPREGRETVRTRHGRGGKPGQKVSIRVRGGRRFELCCLPYDAVLVSIRVRGGRRFEHRDGRDPASRVRRSLNPREGRETVRTRQSPLDTIPWGVSIRVRGGRRFEPDAVGKILGGGVSIRVRGGRRFERVTM